MSSGTFELKSFNSLEEVRRFDKGKVELVNVAGAAIGRLAVVLGIAALPYKARNYFNAPQVEPAAQVPSSR